MSQHSSLKVSSVGVKHRNVLKRHERIRKLKETEKWQDRKSVFGLPKIKSLKIKVKKTKTEKATEEKSATAETTETPQTKTASAKPPEAKTKSS